MKRHGQLIRVKPDKLEEYTKYHAEVWPEILEMIRKCNIRNYSIFHKDGYLFAYFEYVGSDFTTDMTKMAEDPKTQEWWDIMMPMQDPSETRVEPCCGYRPLDCEAASFHPFRFRGRKKGPRPTGLRCQLCKN